MAANLTPGNIAIYNAMQQRPRIKALEDRVARLEKLVMNAPLGAPMDDMVVVNSPPPVAEQPAVSVEAAEVVKTAGGSGCVIN